MNDAWRSIPVGQFCTVTRGASPRPIHQWVAPHGTPWIKISDATASRSRTITQTREFIRNEGRSHSVVVHPGDFIVSNSATPGIPKFVGIDACIHDGWLLLRNFEEVLPEFLYYRLLVDRPVLVGQGNGSVFTNLKTEILKNHLVQLPPLKEQRGIAATLGALDDKIESNRRVRLHLRALGTELVNAAYMMGTLRRKLCTLSSSLTRGVAPKYTDDDSVGALVLNQRCIRDGWVTPTDARKMVSREVAPAKMATAGDILVNSTGVGTLGRVARWHAGTIFVDSHVTVVKPDTTTIPPTILAYLMLSKEADIEDMATGSTGQTELSPTRLGDLVLTIPDPSSWPLLERALQSFEGKVGSLFLEEVALESLRDTLLPELLSGRIRVPEAREAVESAA